MAEYRDFSNDFLRHPDTDDVVTKTGDLSIRQSLRNLFFAEKPFHPEIGVNLNKMLFENMNSVTEIAFKRSITQSIQIYEPRITVEDIVLDMDYDAAGMHITIVYTIKATNTLSKITVFLERLR